MRIATWGRGPAGEVVGKAGGDHHPGPYVAPVEQLGDVTFPRHIVGDREIIRGAVRVDERAALDRPVGVVHRRVQTADVGRRGIAKQDQLDNRNQKHDGQRAWIAYDVDKLFSGNGPQPCIHRLVSLAAQNGGQRQLGFYSTRIAPRGLAFWTGGLSTHDAVQKDPQHWWRRFLRSRLDLFRFAGTS